jgi:hypothetical protein
MVGECAAETLSGVRRVRGYDVVIGDPAEQQNEEDLLQ